MALKRFKEMYLENGIEALRQEYRRIRDTEPQNLSQAFSRKDDLQTLRDFGKRVAFLEGLGRSRKAIVQIINNSR